MGTVKNRFYIIKFATALPYESCNEYECVPSTWMTYHDVERAIAVIAYPRQPACDTDIELMKKHEANWKQFVVKTVFSTDDLVEARMSLAIFQSNVSTRIQEESTDKTSTLNKSQPRTEDPAPTPKESVRKTLRKHIKTENISDDEDIDDDEIDEGSSNSDNDDEPHSVSRVQLLEKLDSIKRILDDSNAILKFLEDDDELNPAQKNLGISSKS